MANLYEINRIEELKENLRNRFRWILFYAVYINPAFYERPDVATLYKATDLLVEQTAEEFGASREEVRGVLSTSNIEQKVAMCIGDNVLFEVWHKGGREWQIYTK